MLKMNIKNTDVWILRIFNYEEKNANVYVYKQNWAKADENVYCAFQP